MRTISGSDPANHHRARQVVLVVALSVILFSAWLAGTALRSQAARLYSAETTNARLAARIAVLEKHGEVAALSARVIALESGINDAADPQPSINDLSSRLDTVESDVSTATANIESITNDVDSATTDLSSLQSVVGSKADDADVSALASKLSTLTSRARSLCEETQSAFTNAGVNFYVTCP